MMVSMMVVVSTAMAVMIAATVMRLRMMMILVCFQLRRVLQV